MILIAFLHLKLSERQELAYIIPLTRARWETALSEAQALSSRMNYTGGKPDKTPDCGRKFSAAQYPCLLENSYTKKPYMYIGFG